LPHLVFNHTELLEPDRHLTSSSFGEITSTLGNATSGTGVAVGGARLLNSLFA
jgi:hypothetical protein